MEIQFGMAYHINAEKAVIPEILKELPFNEIKSYTYKLVGDDAISMKLVCESLKFTSGQNNTKQNVINCREMVDKVLDEKLAKQFGIWYSLREVTAN